MIILNLTLAILLYNSIASIFIGNNIFYCGLVGFSGKKDSKFNLDKIKLLLMINQDRGRDSFGYYTPSSGVIKDTGKVEDFMIKEGFDIPQSDTLISHLRWSTVGFSNKNNAHPFQFGNVVLAMNGTLSNHWKLCQSYELSLGDFNVDSEVLTAMINKDQNYSALEKVIGSCAVIFTNTDNGRVYCYRNSDRPLYMGYIKGNMYMSSTENPLKIIGCNDVSQFVEDYLYEISNGVINNKFKIKRALEPIKEIAPVINLPASSGNTKFYHELDWSKVNTKDLIGWWLKPKHSMSANNGLLICYDYHYQVVDNVNHNTYEIVIIDHNKQRCVVGKYTFDNKIRIIQVNDHVFATEEITYLNSNNKLFCQEGDMLIVTYKGYDFIVCKNLKSNLTIRIDKFNELVRYASILESEEYMIENFDIENQIFKSDEEVALSNEEAPDKYSITTYANLEDKDEELTNAYLNNISLSPSESFQLEVNNAEMISYEDLVDYTINGISDILEQLEECKQSKDGNYLIANAKILMNNYESQYKVLLQAEIEAEDEHYAN